MKSILIIEDELPNFLGLKKLIETRYGDAYQVEGPLTSVEQVYDHLSGGTHPDLILSDIRLSDGVVFDAFDRLDLRVPVIFTTAYNDFVLKAFRYNSIDYLLKPVTPEELEAALIKLERNHAYTNAESLTVLSKVSQQSFRKRFLCNCCDGLVVVGVDEISHIISSEGITTIYTTKQRHFHIDLTLDALVSQLDPDVFFKVSRQSIVHINAISKLQTNWLRKVHLQLRYYPDVEIPVSKNNVSELKKWLDR